jgi:hypothetical protein
MPTDIDYLRTPKTLEKFTGRFPDRLVSQFGEPRTLEQGKKRVDDQFSYLLHPINSKVGGMYAVFFTFSFALFAFVFEDKENFDPLDAAVLSPFD